MRNTASKKERDGLQDKFDMDAETIWAWQKRFCEQRRVAIRRVDKNGVPIKFILTFEEWLRLWIDSGHLHERGLGPGKYVMSRIGDIGNYEIGNVVIKSGADNTREACIGNTFNKGKRGRLVVSEEHKQKLSLLYTGMKRGPSKRAGRPLPEEHRLKLCKPKSEEGRVNMSAAQKGQFWWTDGVVNKRGKECPGEGFVRGKLTDKGNP